MSDLGVVEPRLWVQRDGFAQIEKIMSLTDEDLVGRMSLLCHPIEQKQCILQHIDRRQAPSLGELREHHLDQLSMKKGKLMKSFQVRDLTGLNIGAVLRSRFVMKRVLAAVILAQSSFVNALTVPGHHRSGGSEQLKLKRSGLADVFKIVSTAYPETLHQMVIVNPPAGGRGRESL